MINKEEFAQSLRKAIPEKTAEAATREAFLRSLKITTSAFFEVIQNVGKEYEAGLTTIDLYEWAKVLQVELKKLFPEKTFMSTHPAPRYTYQSNLGLDITVSRSQIWLSEIENRIYICVGGVPVDPALGVPDRE